MSLLESLQHHAWFWPLISGLAALVAGMWLNSLSRRFSKRKKDISFPPSNSSPRGGETSSSESESPNTKRPVLVKNIQFSHTLVPMLDNAPGTRRVIPVLLTGTIAFSGEKLAIVLEYSYFDDEFEPIGWTDRKQVDLTTIRNFVSGKKFTVPIITARATLGKYHTAQWGDSKEEIPKHPVYREHRHRARIRFVADNDREQTYHLIITKVKHGTYNIPTLDNLVTESAFQFSKNWQD